MNNNPKRHIIFKQFFILMYPFLYQVFSGNRAGCPFLFVV
ncbi:hypothetical protein GCWU000324_00141 [Kingella oralis ATCC 51147]|uniref:Uncharacterized protein n=1 Tax=Kingella oralis ATCC 51147 TaxID=629741 RepID=C4GEQ4_9NEIS|nr:hypothetical protein GCWU000324_00141 [Kingella oralis ATCC 51147]